MSRKHKLENHDEDHNALLDADEPEKGLAAEIGQITESKGDTETALKLRSTFPKDLYIWDDEADAKKLCIAHPGAHSFTRKRVRGHKGRLPRGYQVVQVGLD